MVLGLKTAGRNLFKMLSTISGSTKLKNPPSSLADIFTMASVSLARSEEYFSMAWGTLSLQLKMKWKWNGNRNECSLKGRCVVSHDRFLSTAEI